MTQKLTTDHMASSHAVIEALRSACGHDSRPVDGCLNCEAASLLEVRAARLPATDEQYADEQALIDHLEGLMDDGGQGGEKWGAAQAAIAGIIAARQPVSAHSDVNLKWLAGSIGEVAHRLRTYMPHLAEWADRARDCGIAAKVLEDLAARQQVGEARPVAQEPVGDFPLTLRGLIAYGQPAGKPGQGATPEFMCDLIRQMVPHLKRLDALESNAVERGRAEGHNSAIRYVLGYFCSMGEWGSTQYVEILNACGRESIIRSAVADGELEFTGLGRWVAERGTDEDRALIDGQRDAADAAPGVGNG